MRIALCITDIGAPVALHALLTELPDDFVIPLVVVSASETQYLDSVSIAAFRKTIPFSVTEIVPDQTLQPRTIHVATPGDVIIPQRNRNSCVFRVELPEEPGMFLKETLAAFTAFFKKEMTVVVLSGRGDSPSVISSFKVLATAPCEVFVLHRNETVVFDLGRIALEEIPQATQLPAQAIGRYLIHLDTPPVPARTHRVSRH